MVIGKKNLSGNIKPSDQFAPVCKVSAVAIVEGPHPLIVLLKLFLIGDGPMDPVFFKMRTFAVLSDAADRCCTHSGSFQNAG